MGKQDRVLLETFELSKYFGGLKAVDGVSLTVEQGGLHSVIGPNGAGKTTLLNLISGAYKPTSGRITYNEIDITDMPAHTRAHLGMGRSYQITNIFPTLTVLENARLAAQALGKDNLKLLSPYQSFDLYNQQAMQALETVGLGQKAYDLALALSHGDKRRLEVAMLLAQDLEFLLLDEPTAGLGTEQVPEFMQMIRSIGDQSDKTILLVEHNMNVVMNLSHKISVMHHGRLLAEGNPEEIAANPVVQEAYLGSLYDDSSKVAGT
jgi:branched-chain amino acid transport system ATP-binding protein